MRKIIRVCRANEWIGCLATPSVHLYVGPNNLSQALSPLQSNNGPTRADRFHISIDDNHLIAARAVCCLGLIEHHQNEDEWKVDNRRKKKSTCITV